MCRKLKGGRTRWKTVGFPACERKIKWSIETLACLRLGKGSPIGDRRIIRGVLRGRMTIPLRGTAALLVAAAIVAATAIWLPAYRWFLLISVGIGVAVAGGLSLWHKLRPVKDDDIENKRPLGLS